MPDFNFIFVTNYFIGYFAFMFFSLFLDFISAYRESYVIHYFMGILRLCLFFFLICV